MPSDWRSGTRCSPTGCRGWQRPIGDRCCPVSTPTRRRMPPHVRPSDVEAPYDGDPRFDAALLPELRALPMFRLATDEEVDRSYEAYRSGDFARLCAVWCAVAEPTRAELGPLGRWYDRAGWAPARANGLAFV